MAVVRVLVSIYAAFCAMAILLMLSSPDPLSGVYAIFLALPWFFAFSAFGDAPLWLYYIALFVGMLMNGAILWLVGRRITMRWN